MAASTCENRLWANCSWVGGAKSNEFLGEWVGMGLLMTGGLSEGRRTLLERGDLVRFRSGKTSFSAESWLNLRSRTKCSIAAGFGLTSTWNWKLHKIYYFACFLEATIFDIYFIMTKAIKRLQDCVQKDIWPTYKSWPNSNPIKELEWPKLAKMTSNDP